MPEGIDLNEEKAVTEGGVEVEENDPEAVAKREKDRVGGETGATPTELAGGAATEEAVGPSTVEGAPATQTPTTPAVNPIPTGSDNAA